MHADADPWRCLAEQQQGIVSRSQLLSLGLSRSQARRNVANGRWRLLLPGVYATFTGPVGGLAAVLAAVLGAGSGAAASHATALWLGGVIDDRPDVIHISIPAERRVRSHPGVRIHRTRDFSDSVHPAALPPRSRVECAVLDVSETAGPVVVVDIVLRSIQRRPTTALRLRAALSSRPRHRHRALLQEVLDEAGSGVHSQLEGGTCATSNAATDCRPVGDIVQSPVPAAAIGTATCGIDRGSPWSSWTGGRPPSRRGVSRSSTGQCRCNGRRRRAPLRLA